MTNEVGYYNIQFVRIGTYEITVTHGGFAPFKATNISVSRNQIVRTDVMLQVGERVRAVNVEAVTPAIKTDDAGICKNFPLGERFKLQFRAELYNALNSPNFNNPASTFGTGSLGNITSTRTENRDIQLGLKLGF